MTRRATSDASTERNFSAMSIWPRSFSSMDGNVLYALHLTVALRLVRSWVNPMPSNCSGFPRRDLMVGILTSQGAL